jgi:hypothetical protein
MPFPKSPTQPESSAATETVELEAATLRRLVVSTVVTIDEEGDEREHEGREAPRVDDKPRAG